MVEQLPGRATDNILVERLWRTVKYEKVYLHDYSSPREARQGWAQATPLASPSQGTQMHLKNGATPVLTMGST